RSARTNPRRRPAPALAVLALEGRTLPSTAAVADPGFESVAVSPGSFAYDPTGSSWTFEGTAGVAANGSGFTAGNPGAPQGNQVLFVQQQGSASQTLTLPSGTYSISLSAAQRGNLAGTQTLQVVIDGNIVGFFNSLAGTGYSTLT